MGKDVEGLPEEVDLEYFETGALVDDDAGEEELLVEDEASIARREAEAGADES